MKCRLRVVTPIHVGCEVSYPSFSYDVEDNRIIIYDIFNTLSNYLNYDEINKIEKSFEKFRDQKNKNRIKTYAHNFLNCLGINKNELVILDKLHNFGFEKNNRFPEISEFVHFIKDGKIYRYVPGSSIKGAIRTALLWWDWKKKGNLCNYLDKINKEIIEKQNKNVKLDVSEPIFGNIKNNVMKCIVVSDSDPIESEYFGVYLMKRKESISKYCICLKPGSEIEFEIRINKNFEKEYKKLLDILDLNDNVSEKEIIKKILEICDKFYENKLGANLNIGFGGGYDYKTLKELLENCWKNKTLKEIEEMFVKYLKNRKQYLIYFSFPKHKIEQKNRIKYSDFPTTKWEIKNFGKPGFVKIEVI